MSHGPSGRDSCGGTICSSRFHFNFGAVARGVTDRDVGSGDLLGFWGIIEHYGDSNRPKLAGNLQTNADEECGRPCSAKREDRPYQQNAGKREHALHVVAHYRRRGKHADIHEDEKRSGADKKSDQQ